MEINITNNDSYSVISISGRLDTQKYSDAEGSMTGILDSGVTKVIADLSGLEYISSSGLRVFLSALKKVKPAGGNIILCGLQDNIREVFDISGLVKLFTIKDNLAEAEGAI